jgi:hypothetical protein
VITNVILSVASIALVTLFTALPNFWSVWIGGTIAGALVVPLESHVIIALYYRLTEPERPVLPDESPRQGWQSVWDEERE